MEIRVKIDGVEQTINALNATASQIVYGQRLALNRTAQIVKDTLVRVMSERAFDRPTPWTLRSMYVDKATKENPSAAVYFKDFAPKGVPGGRFLKAEIFGGPRVMKSSERKVGGYLIPSIFMPVDQYGNVRGGEYTRLLSHLHLHSDMLQNVTESNKSTNKRAKLEYFRRGDMIWQKKGKRSALPAWLIQKTPPMYRRRFWFHNIGEAVAARNIANEMAKAVTDAIKWNK